MNCDRALVALLDAELPELTTSTTTLAMHVRSCARCRRVADRLMTDTHLLAAAMSASGARPRRPIHTYAMARLALAASLLVMVAVQRRDVTPETNRPALLPPVVTETAAPAPSIEPVAASPAPHRVTREFPRAVPFAATKLVEPAAVTAPPAATIASGVVTVDPPAGTRAVVMQTSVPKLVVVWLY
jgi:hypothetical protein